MAALIAEDPRKTTTIAIIVHAIITKEPEVIYSRIKAQKRKSPSHPGNRKFIFYYHTFINMF